MIELTFWQFLALICLVLVLFILLLLVRSHSTEDTQWIKKDSLKDEIRRFAIAQDGESAKYWIMFADYIDNYTKNEGGEG